MTDHKRPWLAAALAFLYPGLGHVYLREWLRAALWFSLVISSMAFLVGDSVSAPLESGVTVESATAALHAVPMEANLALLAITVLSMADAYWMATRENEMTDVIEGAKCPTCGKELDEDIDFCHWCTTKLEQPVEAEN